MIKRMRWRAFFFLENGETEERQQENHHRFKTRKCQPKVEELDEFEEDLLTMIEEVRFRNTTNRFQQRLKEDIWKIRKSKNIIVPADETRNMYEVSEQQYEKLLTNNITKNYKLAQPKRYDSINQEAKEIAQSMKI